MTTDNEKSHAKQNETPNRLQQNIWIAIMVSAYLINSVGNSISNTYFPHALEEKGIGSALCSVVISSVFIPQLLFSPFLGSVVIKFGAVNLFRFGLVLYSVGLACLSITELIAEPVAFVVSCFALKIVQGMGMALVNTSVVCIATECITDRTSFTLGVLGTGAGLGYVFGPPLGGFIFDVSNYKMPFITGGMLQFSNFLVSFCTFRNVPDLKTTPDEKNKQSVKKLLTKLLKIKTIDVTLLLVFLAFFIPCCYDVLFPIYCAHQTNLTVTMVGILLLIFSMPYPVTAVICGLIIDKKGNPKVVILIGAVSNLIVYLILAILSSTSNLDYRSLVACMTIQCGFASLMYVPAFKLMKDVTKMRSMAECKELNVALSNVLVTFEFIGMFGGNAGAGLIYDGLGLKNGLFILFGLVLAAVIALCITHRQEQNRFLERSKVCAENSFVGPGEMVEKENTITQENSIEIAV